MILRFNKYLLFIHRRPRQDKDDPTFKYKPDVAVRKKAERDKLPAVSCDLCEEVSVLNSFSVSFLL